MYLPQIKVIKSDPKWTSFIYVASSSKSRMMTKLINTKVEKNEIEVVNPELLFESGVNADRGALV